MANKGILLMQLLAAMAVIAGLSGCTCCPTMPRFSAHEIQIEADESVRDISLRVHLVGIVGADGASLLRSVDVNKYWQEPMSIGKGVDFKFGRNMDHIQGLSKKDPVWGLWKANAANWLLIVTDMPGSYSAGEGDSRKVVLPLDKRCWKGKPLQIRLTQYGIIPLTERNPTCN